MEHNQLTFEALKDAIDTLPPRESIKIYANIIMDGMGSTILKTDRGFLCSPEFLMKAQADWNKLITEETITVIELSPDEPDDINTPPAFTMDQIKLWKL